MLNPYEIVSRSALPALRAIVSKRLKDRYSMTQQQIATRMGITQASVSNYARKARGVMIDLEMDPTVAKAVDRVASILASETGDEREAVRTMTEVCDYIRFKHLMCNLHRDLEPGLTADGCDAGDGSYRRQAFERLNDRLS